MTVKRMINSYRSFKDGTLSDWQMGDGLDKCTQCGYYIVRISHRDVAAQGLPFVPADEKHYLVGHLFVSETGCDDKLQRGRGVAQTLLLNDCNNLRADVYCRSGACANGECFWDEWTRLVGNSDLNDVKSELEDKLQQCVDVGQVASLDGLVASGMYTGTFSNGDALLETFVLFVIDNFAAAGATSNVRSVSQFKYALNVDGTFSHKTRTGQGAKSIAWGSWVDLGAATTTDIQDNSITAQKLSIALQEQINQNTANATKAANGAYWTSGPKAVTLNINKNDGTVGWQTLPAATTEKAGVVTAEDKINMEKTLIVQYGRNLFVKEDATAVGLVGSIGEWNDFADWRTTEHYVNIMPNTAYTASARVAVAMYDADKNFIKRPLDTQTDYEFTTPANACYARISVYDYEKSSRMVTLASEWNDGVYEEGVFPAVNTVSGSPFVLTSGKFKIATLGDSITYSGRWQRIISRLTGCTFFNNGLSGKTISSFVFHRKQGSATDFDRILTAEDFEGCNAIVICGYANSLWEGIGSMEKDYVTINADDANADVQAYASTIGQNGYIGALRSVIEYLMRICPGIPIIISGQLPMSRAKEGVGGATNSVDFNRVYDYSHKTCAEFSEATKMVAEYYHLPYVDMEKQGQVNILNYSSYYNEGDTTHPNFKEFDNEKNEFPLSGTRQMALLILDALRKVIPL